MDKKIKYLMMFAAIAALATGLTACSSEDDLASDEQQRGVVKTEFTISIPQFTSGTTRQFSTVVQSAEDLNSFRGIKDIELYPFNSQVSTTFPSTSTEIPSKIVLLGGVANKKGASGSTDNSIASTGALYNTSKSHLYEDVEIPIGTQSFMFYGEAATDNSTTGDKVSGTLEKSLSTSTNPSLDDITFSLKQICSDGTVGTNGINIAAYLTSIANAQTTGGKKWSETPNFGLGVLYDNFTKNTAGSWTNVKALVQEMYTNLAEKTTDAQETKDMKKAIREAIINKTTYGVHDDDNDGVLTFTNDMGSYPRDINLPDGAAYVKWNPSTAAFEAKADNANTGMNMASLSSYVYPASLYYRVLSNIKTSSEAKGAKTDVFNDTNDWSDILAKYTTEEGYDINKVSSKTRSIVIEKPVQYAVGRLDAHIQTASVTLKDNDAGFTGYNVDASTGTYKNAFKVTGILVGGQKPVDYKFEQRTGNSYSTFYTIYDQSIDGDIYLNSAKSTTPIYTLALETAAATAAVSESYTDAAVTIAVEFENNSGRTIVGYNNELIPNGCRFYLVGTLDPYSNTSQKYAGTDDVIKKAFVQDYKTIVTLKIESLKNAHNTLPDLRVPQMEMGLAIDLSWKTGITQDITIE